MASDSDDATLGIQVGNQFINAANARLEQGLSPDVVAQGMRHAAANFTAFVVSHDSSPDDTADACVDEFKETLDYYLPIHLEQREPQTGLEQLIETVKKEQSTD